METGPGADPPDLGAAEGTSAARSEPPPMLMAGGSEGSSSVAGGAARLSRYVLQKRRDWSTFQQYLKNHKPPLSLSRCSGAHVLEFLRYQDQFGKTKVHVTGCPYFGQPNQPEPCVCPLKQAWGSLDALIGRLRAAYEENGGRAEANPFGAKAVRTYLMDVRAGQTKARGVPYEKKKKRRRSRKRPGVPSSSAGGEGWSRQEGSTAEGGRSVGGATS